MGRTKKDAAAANEAAQDVREAREASRVDAVPAGAGTPPEGRRVIAGPEDEAELLGCQEGPSDDPPFQYAVTAEGGLNLREAPGFGAPILAVLPRGAGVFDTGTAQGPWMEVVTGRLAGWVLSEHLEPLSMLECPPPTGGRQPYVVD